MTRAAVGTDWSLEALRAGARLGAPLAVICSQTELSLARERSVGATAQAKAEFYHVDGSLPKRMGQAALTAR